VPAVARQDLSRDRLEVVAQHRPPAAPLPIPAGRRDLVPGPLADDLPLELDEGEDTLSTSRPMLLAVLNCWVTLTKATPRSSKVLDGIDLSRVRRFKRFEAPTRA
jgi:hypothetical protein